MSERTTTATSTGIGVGAAVAAAMSWSIHHSILWALIHGAIGWLYILGYLLGWAQQWTPPVS